MALMVVAITIYTLRNKERYTQYSKWTGEVAYQGKINRIACKSYFFGLHAIFLMI